MTALSGLDDEQRQVAEAIHGPVVVLAGAGTGKTRAITHRIAHAVEMGAHDPRRTLAVTFTARAAGEMRTRLRDLGVDGVQARTFHAAALRQLRYFWPRTSSGDFPELIASKARIVAEAAHHCNLSTDKATVRDLASDLEWCKANLVSGAGIAVAAGAAARVLTVDADQLGLLESAYEDIKRSRGLLDFEDVIRWTAGMLVEHPSIADEVRAAYRWFTVDEYQDVNPLQELLLQTWLGGRDDLCVVGDPSQTIYTFTGASPRYLESFRTRYPDATEVRLVRCYRCTPQVVGLANALKAGPLTLQSQKANGPAPTIEVLADDVAEAGRIADLVREHLKAGVAARDIAVLFRTNGQSAELEEAFAEAGLPVILRGTERFFDRPEVRQAITLIRGAARAGSTGAIADQVRGILSGMGWTSEPPRTAGAVRDRWESLSALVTLAEELEGLMNDSLPAFVIELDSRSEAQHAPISDAVTLSSIHSAKGLEWSVVCIVGCSEGLLPISLAVTEEQRQEERRLFYVAVTRAADHLHLTWSRARQPGGRPVRNASPFLADAFAGDSSVAADAIGGVVSRGSGRVRGERLRKGPAKCRVCAKALVTAGERTLGRCDGCPADLNVDLLDALKAWRLDVARENEVPAFMVFTDVTLIAVAEQLPTDDSALLDIPGIGPSKLAAYGAPLLDLVKGYTG